MKNNIVIPTPEQHEQMRQIAERFYGTASHPDQIQINHDAEVKLRALHSHAVLCVIADHQPVSWIVVVPTQKALARKFLDHAMTERALYDQTLSQSIYDALYLCSVFTLPAYRRKGYAADLLREVMKHIPLTKDALLFGWLYSKEGEALYRAMQKEYPAKVEVRQDA